MPEVALAIASTAGLAAFNLGASVAVTNAIVSVTAFAVSQAAYQAVSFGIDAAANAIIGQSNTGAPAAALSQAAIPAPRPEDVQQTITQATASRIVHFGRVKVGGSVMIADSRQGYFYKLVAINHGEIDSVEQYWIGDTQVTIDGGGNVQTAPWTGKAQFEYLPGTAGQAASAIISGGLAEWTADHRGRGVAQLATRLWPVSQDEYLATWPNGVHTSFRVVLKGVKVKNPVTSAIAWSDNPAAIIMDLVTSADGLNLPAAMVETTQAVAGWQAAFAACNTAIALKGGGTEPQYRLWGSRSLAEQPGDVLARMLANCDGRLVTTRDGGVTLEIGSWAEPTVILDEDVITHVEDFGRGRSILSTANTIKARYLEPGADYQTTDAEPWVDATDVAARGEIIADREFILSPSHSQARRLMKKAYYRANPDWVGVFYCTLGAMAAFNERLVRIRLTAYSLDAVFEVTGFEIMVEQGNIPAGVRITAHSMPEAAYQWAAAEEEGAAAVSDTLGAGSAIPLPQNFGVTLERRTIGSVLYPYAVLAFDAPPVASLLVEARFKKTADSDWQAIGVQDGAASAESPVLEDGAEYEFQVRHVTIGRRAGDWTSSETLDVVADAVAPGVVTGVSATGGAGEVALAWTSPNSANYSAANIYRHTADVEGSATKLPPRFGPPSSSETWTDTGLAAGTYYYWIRARNASGVESASVATGAVTAT